MRPLHLIWIMPSQEMILICYMLRVPESVRTPFCFFKSRVNSLPFFPLSCCASRQTGAPLPVAEENCGRSGSSADGSDCGKYETAAVHLQGSTVLCIRTSGYRYCSGLRSYHSSNRRRHCRHERRGLTPEGRRSRKREHARREPGGVPGTGCIQLTENA